ncbi:MAG: hypothetical protein J7599_07935 [Niabella sp.]|nr:hypothetical protein [Niabella sp.]
MSGKVVAMLNTIQNIATNLLHYFLLQLFLQQNYLQQNYLQQKKPGYSAGLFISYMRRRRWIGLRGCRARLQGSSKAVPIFVLPLYWLF